MGTVYNYASKHPQRPSADSAFVRRARVHIPGVVHHLIWRCLNREWLITNDDDRDRYRWWLGRALTTSDWRCVAYAIMSNHVHLAVVAGEEPLAAWSRRAHTPFALWMNQQHGRLGPFFAGRASDYALGPIGAATTIGYIHNNPVRAGLVTAASETEWTSHRAYLRLDPVPSWLDVDEGMRLTSSKSQEAFDAFVLGAPQPPERPRPGRITAAVSKLGQINEATPQEDRVPVVIRPYARVRPDPSRVLYHVSRMLCLDPQVIASRRRVPQIVRARLIVAHASRALGLTDSDVAAVLGISRQAVSLMMRRRSSVEQCEEVCRRIAGEIRVPGGSELAQV